MTAWTASCTSQPTYGWRGRTDGAASWSIVEDLFTAEVVDVNARDDRGRTLLHYAVEQDNVEAVRMLLALKSKGKRVVDVDARDKLD